ncbi:MAG: TVP38/TMEM64 family protein [Thermoanaerobaculia bacterium]
MNRDDGATASGRPRGSTRLWLAAALFAALFVAFRLLPAGEWIDSARDWIAALGPWGPAVFVALYAVATVAAAPAIVLTVAAGPMFGPALGFAAVSAGATLGAAAAFAVARWLARDAVARRLAGNATFLRLDRLVERNGWVVVAITRLIPLFPFNLLNYAFGLTGIRFGTYVWASWLFMLPGTALYVFGGDTLFRGLSGGTVSPAVIGALALAAIVVVLATRRARRWLRDAEAEDRESR